MSLPIDFVASATALECYLSCPRRFRHRYIDHLPTAGPDHKSSERMRRGDLFHKLVLWDALGLDASMILQTENDPELTDMWASYQDFRATLAGAGVAVLHDQVLTARCGTMPVQARLDALAFGPAGDVTIYDWKTSFWPNRARLVNSPQSKVYPFVVWNNRSRLDELAGQSRVNLVYWFPEEPEQPLRILCDSNYIEASTDWLRASIDTVVSDTSFEMTDDRSICRTCEYLAHCGVQTADGPSQELDEDYYQIPEVDEDVTFIDTIP